MEMVQSSESKLVKDGEMVTKKKDQAYSMTVKMSLIFRSGYSPTGEIGGRNSGVGKVINLLVFCSSFI